MHLALKDILSVMQNTTHGSHQTRTTDKNLTFREWTFIRIHSTKESIGPWLIAHEGITALELNTPYAK